MIFKDVGWIKQSEIGECRSTLFGMSYEIKSMGRRII
jgi:hypothetical protein